LALTNSFFHLPAILATLLWSVSVAIRVRANNSNGTTVGTFSNFNLLFDRCTLLPFPSLLTSLLCTPG